jgi:hypothetical protein
MTRIEFSPALCLRKEKNVEQVLLDTHRISPAVCLRKEKNAEQVLLDTHRISPAVSYGRKKQNHEVIEHILSDSVRKCGDLESTTKSCITFFCSW